MVGREEKRFSWDPAGCPTREMQGKLQVSDHLSIPMLLCYRRRPGVGVTYLGSGTQRVIGSTGPRAPASWFPACCLCRHPCSLLINQTWDSQRWAECAFALLLQFLGLLAEYWAQHPYSAEDSIRCWTSLRMIVPRSSLAQVKWL